MTVQISPTAIGHGASVDRHREFALLETANKRERAAQIRRLAERMSLKTDRDVLLAQAADLEAQAERIERQFKT